MYQICRLAEDKYPLKIKDLSGEGISQYYKYLKKVVGIDLDKLNPEWKTILTYNKLRNHLVHLPTNTLYKNEDNKIKIETFRAIQFLDITETEMQIELRFWTNVFCLASAL